MPEMSRRERVEAAVRGEQVDRPPWSLWRHFYEAEQTAEQLAANMVGWVRKYPFDFLKVNPRAQYHVEVWGARYRYSGREHDRPERLDYPISTPEDWQRLEPRGLDAAPLAEQITALRAIKSELHGEVPFIETVFTPLAIAGYLVEDNQTLVRHLRERPDLVHLGLESITRTFAPFAAACLQAGADGIFFATTRWASRDYLTSAEYAEFGRPYDLHVLDAVREAPFNVLHVCDRENMLLDHLPLPPGGETQPNNSPLPRGGEAQSNNSPLPGREAQSNYSPLPRGGEGQGEGTSPPPESSPRLARLADYPVQALNWAATDPTNPSIAQAATLGHLRIAGISGEALGSPDPNHVIREVNAAREQAGPTNWALGPNCSIPTTSREENIRAAGRAIGVPL